MLGLKTGIFGKMANDRNSKFLRASMDDLGIEYRLTLDGSAGSFAEILLDHQGDRAIYMLRGATAELTPSRNSPEARRIHPARTYRHDGDIGVAARDGRRDSALRAATHKIQRLYGSKLSVPERSELSSASAHASLDTIGKAARRVAASHRNLCNVQLSGTASGTPLQKPRPHPNS